MQFLGWSKNKHVAQVLRKRDVIVIPTEEDDEFTIAVPVPHGGTTTTRRFWMGMVNSIHDNKSYARVKYLTKGTDISQASFANVNVPRGKAGSYVIHDDTVTLIIRGAPVDEAFDILTPLLDELQSAGKGEHAESTGKSLTVCTCLALPNDSFLLIFFAAQLPALALSDDVTVEGRDGQLIVAFDFGRTVTGMVVARQSAVRQMMGSSGAAGRAATTRRLELLLMQPVHGDSVALQLSQIRQALQPHLPREAPSTAGGAGSSRSSSSSQQEHHKTVHVVRVLYEKVLMGAVFGNKTSGRSAFTFIGKNMIRFQSEMKEGVRGIISAATAAAGAVQSSNNNNNDVQVEFVGLHHAQKGGGLPAGVGRAQRKNLMMQAAAHCLRQGSYCHQGRQPCVASSVQIVADSVVGGGVDWLQSMAQRFDDGAQQQPKQQRGSGSSSSSSSSGRSTTSRWHDVADAFMMLLWHAAMKA